MSDTNKRKIAINGFGRIGRAAFKIALSDASLEVVAINDLTDAHTLAALLRRDTVYGAFNKTVEASDAKPIDDPACTGSLIVDGKTYPILAERDPVLLPWKALDVAIVVECTGVFREEKDLRKHIDAGAKRVVLSAPAKDDATAIAVLGVSDLSKEKDTEIISNASCTTNCISPIMAILHEAFGVEKAMMTTVHAYTSDQNLVDGPHKDIRRARAAAHNIVPTTTGAAIATTKVIPDLADKFDGISIRVPVIAGSLSDITLIVQKAVTREDVNNALRLAAQTSRFAGIVEISDEPLVSSDIIGNAHSAIVDTQCTSVVGGTMVKVLAWYDNEFGYANRLVELVSQLSL